jgi:hypothetical protein
VKIAISQPTCLSGSGYFDLIDQLDVFVLLDDVQFERRSGQQTTRIKTAIGRQWLTVPVMFHGRFSQFLKDVEIPDVEFSRTHLRAVEQNYRRSRFFGRYFADLAACLKCTALEVIEQVQRRRQAS